MADDRTRLTDSELERFREVLLDKRREVLTDFRDLDAEAASAGEAGDLSNVPQHLGEQGTQNADEKMVRRLAERERDLVAEIDAALLRIDDGTYGICERTGEPISKARLEAKPWARLSIEAAERRDAGLSP